MSSACIGSDPGCPCQDGLACHYRDIPGSPAWPVPTVHTRLPDLRTELERFNAEREAIMGGHPIDVDSRMPLPRSGVGGDVEE